MGFPNLTFSTVSHLSKLTSRFFRLVVAPQEKFFQIFYIVSTYLFSLLLHLSAIFFRFLSFSGLYGHFLVLFGHLFRLRTHRLAVIVCFEFSRALIRTLVDSDLISLHALSFAALLNFPLVTGSRGGLRTSTKSTRGSFGSGAPSRTFTNRSPEAP